MKYYKKIKKEIDKNLSHAYSITVKFMNSGLPLEITFTKEAPKKLIYQRIKFMFKMYEYLFNLKTYDIVPFYNAKSLEFTIFVRFKNA